MDDTALVHFKNETIISGRYRLTAPSILERKNYYDFCLKSRPHQNNRPSHQPAFESGIALTLAAKAPSECAKVHF